MLERGYTSGQFYRMESKRQMYEGSIHGSGMAMSTVVPAMHEPVSIVYGTSNHAYRYRCLHLQEQLALYGIASRICHVCEVPLSLAACCDVLILHRVPYDRRIGAVAERIRQHGGIVLFDTDDLVFADALLPDGTGSSRDPFGAMLRRSEIQRNRKMVQAVDAVLVSTDYLARSVVPSGKLVYVLRNAFSLEMLALSERAHQERMQNGNRVVIGYASGTPTHNRDFAVAKPALIDILRRYPESELWLIGSLDIGDGWEGVSNRIRRISCVPWRDLPALLAQFDINIAPLESNNPFCHAKSEVKYIEAGLVRVPTIASRTDAFEYAIRSGDNGFLATVQQEWLDALEQLVIDASLRREMGQRAYADVLARYHPLVRGCELIDTLNEISRKVRGYLLWPADLPRPEADLITERLQSTGMPCGQDVSQDKRSLLGRALYALRHRGIRIFLMQVWVYLHSGRLAMFSSCRAGTRGCHGNR